jgi:pilus assembly protein CpaF
MAAKVQESFTLPGNAVDRYIDWLRDELRKATLSNNGNHRSWAEGRRLLQTIHERTRVQIPDELKNQLFNLVLDDLFGYGPIQGLIDDPTITEIMVNGPRQIYVERKGKLEKTDAVFPDNQAVHALIDKIIKPLGRKIDPDHPTVDARLPDGSRVNAVIPPVAIDGPGLTIRKFSRDKYQIKDLIEFGSVTEAMAKFLEACVVARLNTLISGGTGSGKTTLLNVLSAFVPESERIVTIEDSAELQLHQEHIFRLETKSANEDGRCEVTVRDLVRNALRMRPDRIIVGEVRGREALDMLQAMNTGHDGSLTTLHANSPRDAISRLETLVLMAGLDLPLRSVREQIASAIDLIVQQSRIRDGSRKVVSITEVVGMEGDTIVLNEIFHFKETGMDSDGVVHGDLSPTGLRPMFIGRLEEAGFSLPPTIFGADLIQFKPPKRRGEN